MNTYTAAMKIGEQWIGGLKAKLYANCGAMIQKLKNR